MLALILAKIFKCENKFKNKDWIEFMVAPSIAGGL